MEIKIATYNVDGLPGSLDLRQLPWPLKPISWLYKAFKGTTLITINDGQNKAANTKEISRRLAELDADIVAVQEDFNYHKELMSSLPYKHGWHSGGITLDNIRWWPYPKFKADGINILTNDRINFHSETIIPWEKSHGYFSHANDKLTTKGFRCYTVVIANRIPIQIAIVHMDADFYDPIKCPNVGKDVVARKSQFEQLACWISLMSGLDGRLVVMGDFNSYPKYEWDKANIDYFLSLVPGLELAVPENREYCDHIFVRGINVKRCYFDMSFGNISDHKPLIAELEL